MIPKIKSFIKRLKKSNRKAFTFVELIAVIVILGVILAITVPVITRATKKAKLELMESHESTLALTGKDYFISNRDKLPKVDGEVSTVPLQTLIEEGYISNILDYNKEKCSGSDSFVDAERIGTGEYEYNAFLSCTNYETGQLWSDWSEWMEDLPTVPDMDVETVDFYNYQEGIAYWEDWSAWADLADSGNVIHIADIVATETQYQYQDQEWIWNNGGEITYAPDPFYYLTAPVLFPIKDVAQSQWDVSYTTFPSGTIEANSDRKVQYKDEVTTNAATTYTYDDTTPIVAGYTDRQAWAGDQSAYIYKTYAGGNNGYSYTYDSNKTSALSVRTRTQTWGAWTTVTTGSVTSSSTRGLQKKDKQYRYSKYKYHCWYVPTGAVDIFYKSTYDTTPPLSWCGSWSSWTGIYYVSGSRVSKYGDYDRNEGNVTGNTIDSVYGRKSWTVDGAGVYYSYETTTGTVSYDVNRWLLQYRDLNYSSYTGYETKTSGTYVVSHLQDLAYKDKLYVYSKSEWDDWSADQTSGTYSVSATKQVQYKNNKYKYYMDEFAEWEDGLIYSSEQPLGFPIVDEASEQLTDWSAAQATEPEDETYRTRQSQTRDQLVDFGGNMLVDYLSAEDFETLDGLNLTEAQVDTEKKIVTKTMYRYRTKSYE